MSHGRARLVPFFQSRVTTLILVLAGAKEERTWPLRQWGVSWFTLPLLPLLSEEQMCLGLCHLEVDVT